METRIVTFSDTHNWHDSITLPECDIALFAGDFSSRGSWEDTSNFFKWYNRQDQCKHKILIAGNHDLCFDHQTRFVQETESNEWLDTVLSASPNLIYLENSFVTLEGLTIWGSPVTPDFYPQHWSFNKQRGEEIRKIWNKMIDCNPDIVLTHGPVYGIHDKCNDGHVGCGELKEVIKLIKPKLFVCGHIHEGYGSYQGENTLYVNASICDASYRPINDPKMIKLVNYENSTRSLDGANI